MSMYWPILLIVGSNVFYQICSKSTPKEVNPLAAITVTYLVGALVSAVLFFLLSPEKNLFAQYRHLNWSTFVLGFAIVGLEAGSIYMYKAGWNISTGQLVHSSILAIGLLFIGYFIYNESITPTKVIGILTCLFGLFLVNR